MASGAGLLPNFAQRVMAFSGGGFLAGIDPGIVTIAGAPSKARIFVYEKATHRLVDTTTSDENGEWRVDFLDQNRRYYIVAFDANLQFNAVIRDNITPAPMA